VGPLWREATKFRKEDRFKGKLGGKILRGGSVGRRRRGSFTLDALKGTVR